MIIKRIWRIVDPLKCAISEGMTVGQGVTLADKRGTSFGSEPYLITLGDNVRLSGGVKFFTHDGGTWAFRDLPEYSDVFKFGKIVVGDRTFIGHSAIILPGVTIGKRCVIGAGAVVTKDVPDETVVAGNPARKICSTFEYADKVKRRFIEEGHNREEYNVDRKRYLLKKLK